MAGGQVIDYWIRNAAFGRESSWLALELWRELQLDALWAQRLRPSRKGSRWDEVLEVLVVLVVYRPRSPGSEWRLRRQWYQSSALADLLGADSTIDFMLRPLLLDWNAPRHAVLMKHIGPLTPQLEAFADFVVGLLPSESEAVSG